MADNEEEEESPEYGGNQDALIDAHINAESPESIPSPLSIHSSMFSSPEEMQPEPEDEQAEFMGHLGMGRAPQAPAQLVDDDLLIIEYPENDLFIVDELEEDLRIDDLEAVPPGPFYDRYTDPGCQDFLNEITPEAYEWDIHHFPEYPAPIMDMEENPPEYPAPVMDILGNDNQLVYTPQLNQPPHVPDADGQEMPQLLGFQHLQPSHDADVYGVEMPILGNFEQLLQPSYSPDGNGEEMSQHEDYQQYQPSHVPDADGHEMPLPVNFQQLFQPSHGAHGHEEEMPLEELNLIQTYHTSDGNGEEIPQPEENLQPEEGPQPEEEPADLPPKEYDDKMYYIFPGTRVQIAPYVPSHPGVRGKLWLHFYLQDTKDIEVDYFKEINLGYHQLGFSALCHCLVFTTKVPLDVIENVLKDIRSPSKRINAVSPTDTMTHISTGTGNEDIRWARILDDLNRGDDTMDMGVINMVTEYHMELLYFVPENQPLNNLGVMWKLIEEVAKTTSHTQRTVNLVFTKKVADDLAQYSHNSQSLVFRQQLTPLYKSVGFNTDPEEFWISSPQTQINYLASSTLPVERTRPIRFHTLMEIKADQPAPYPCEPEQLDLMWRFPAPQMLNPEILHHSMHFFYYYPDTAKTYFHVPNVFVDLFTGGVTPYCHMFVIHPIIGYVFPPLRDFPGPLDDHMSLVLNVLPSVVVPAQN